MKTKIILVVSFLLFTNLMFAQNAIVALHRASNDEVLYFNNASPVVAAYNAAVAGDTIYVPGGSFPNPIKYEKKLTIYGAGIYPIATTATLPTKLTGNFTISDEADGLHLEGVELPDGLSFDTNEAVTNVLIKRNNIRGDINIAQSNGMLVAENNYFVENIIRYMPNLNNLINSYFLNNIIEDRVSYVTQITFLNNLFLFNSASYQYWNINAAFSCLFKNNVFVRSQSYNDYINNSSTSSSTWSHNVFIHTNPNLGFSPININNYTSVNRADLFINQTGDVFNYSHDYHLQATAASTYLGDDGTEVGIYGGISPFKGELIPINPHISNAVISSQSDANGTINVNIQVQAQYK